MQLLLTAIVAMAGSSDAADPRAGWLALGDSYTIGEGVAPDANWPSQLTARLADQGIAPGDPQIIAVTGWTTDELADALREAQVIPPYPLVTLMIGVNNQYRGRDIANYRAEFGALLQRAIALAGDRAAHVIVISIPDWGATRFAQDQARDALHIAQEIDAFNDAAREIAQHEGARFVDVTAVSRDAGDAAGELVDDGLHPSAVQYARWTDLILPVARSVLGGSTAKPG